ncbi:hypothetical protein IU471_01375 [Nocardia elegans]|uniref:Uncharacterized protein n=1 Tax=Nocardia elegans TaxID=300029 RepID=A0ABW6T765_9NOCA|nr:MULTISPECIES: hypothetical protein [Nocardia]MBF6242229.1 hypothetical protein [Nocardia elegans]MBF6446940.1 hypothetical protein [Nocardia elegans]
MSTPSLSHGRVAARLPHRTSVVSILIPGGYCDDDEVGIDGFAHLREHWALHAVSAVVAPARIVRRSARTLRSTTELDLVVSGPCEVDADTVLDELRGYPEFDRVGEIEKIADEVHRARAHTSATAVDLELPRSTGWSSGWGYGDPVRLVQVSTDEFHRLVDDTWSGIRPVVSTAAVASLAAEWPTADELPAALPADRDLEVAPSRAEDDGNAEYHRAAVGWVVRYRSPAGTAIVDDCLRFLGSFAVPAVRQRFPDLAINFRLGQFGERFTSAESDLVVAWVQRADGTTRADTIRAYLDALFATARGLLEDEAIPLGALHNRRRLDAVLHGADVLAYARWRSRAAHLGLGQDHPYLCPPGRAHFAEFTALLQLLDALASAGFVLVDGGGR